MNIYLGHQFANGKCILCGANEKSVREFHSQCSKAEVPISPAKSSALPPTAQGGTASTTAVGSSESKEKQKEDPQTVSASALHTNRYRDAYLVAKATGAIGLVIKNLGLALGALIVIVALAIAASDGAQFALIGIFAGIAVAIPVYILGILVSAQAQILKATLDTAVNTSPLLSNEDKAWIISL